MEISNQARRLRGYRSMSLEHLSKLLSKAKTQRVEILSVMEEKIRSEVDLTQEIVTKTTNSKKPYTSQPKVANLDSKNLTENKKTLSIEQS